MGPPMSYCPLLELGCMEWGLQMVTGQTDHKLGLTVQMPQHIEE